MTPALNKIQLLDAMQTGHHRFNIFLSEIPADQMLLPHVVGEWSIKDILAHIVVHEQRMIEWVTNKLEGKPITDPQPYSMPEHELTVLNEQIFQQNRYRALEEILSDLDTTYFQALALVEAVSEAGLFDRSYVRLRDGEALWEAVAANTYWHYEEHERDIRTWLSK